MLSTIISLPADLRKDLVHLSCLVFVREVELWGRGVWGDERRGGVGYFAGVSFHFELICETCLSKCLILDLCIGRRDRHFYDIYSGKT